MGTPDFAAVILRYLAANDCDVVKVYTQPDKTAGRGRGVAACPVKRAALELGLPVVQPVTFRDEQATAIIAELTALKPDVAVVAAYGQILPQAVLDVPRRGCLNVHPSLLPRFRGVSPVPAAILAGDEFTGVSVMLLDAGIDTGPILARAAVPISPADTTGSLSDTLARVGAPLLLHVLSLWLKDGGIEPRPQDEAMASYCKKLVKADGEIDWRLPAVDIWRRVRAYNPWPGAATTWQGRQLRILEADGGAGRGRRDVAGARPGHRSGPRWRDRRDHRRRRAGSPGGPDGG